MTARIARVCTLLLVGTLLTLVACSSSGANRARKKSDASNYNMQLGKIGRAHV